MTPTLHTLVFLAAGLLVRGRARVLVAMVPLGAVALDLLAPLQARVLTPILASLQYDSIGQFAALGVITLEALVLLAAPSQRTAPPCAPRCPQRCVAPCALRPDRTV